MKPMEQKTRERIQKNPKIRLFKSVLWNIKPVELKIFIKDILEKEVDKKYYLSPLLQERFSKYLEEKNKKLGLEEPACLDLYNKKIKEDGTSITLSDPCHNNLRLIEGEKVYDNAQGKVTEEIYEINPENDIKRPSYIQFQNGNHSEAHRIYNSDGIFQTVKPTALKIYSYKSFDGSSKENGRVLREHKEEGITPTLTSQMGMGGNNVPMVMNCVGTCFGRRGTSKEEKDIYNKTYQNSGQLRRLTPKECFRLMGFLNDEINLDGLSDTQRYKLAGNGQDVNMVSLIFKEMLK